MKSSLKTFLTAAVLGLAVLPSLSLSAADEKGPPPGGGAGGGRGGRGGGTPEQQVARLEEAVGTLTADQKTKIMAIYTKSSEQMQALPQEERRTKGQELRMAAGKEVRALLTPEQQTKFDAMPQGGRGGPGGPGGGGKKE